VFYAWWDWRFLGLLIGMSLLSWLCGYLINRSQYTLHHINAKCCMITSIVINVGILALFKYYNFFVGSFADLFGLQNSILSLKFVLPLGISFFTFQAIAYVVDVYKRKTEPTNLVDCLLYIGFFPKLLAGPIERPTNLIPQIQKPRVFKYDLAVDGCRQMLWGLFKKVVIADNAALYVNQVYGDYANQSGSTLLLAAILYTIQIYGDFSGYSDMAIGTAKLLGFRFRDNFMFPYFSRNMNEFWRRWHISLNTWFVDYVYIPLGGSRNGKWHTIRNIMIVFLLSGLWHGADWSFVAWGAYHGLLLVLLILLNRNTKYEHAVAYDKWYPSVKEFGQMLLVFALATFGWMMFRADNMTQFLDYTARMCSTDLFSMPKLQGNTILFMNIALMFIIEWCMRRQKHGLDHIHHTPYTIHPILYTALRYTLYTLIFLLILLFGGHTENFIYMYF
jgi:D-alanyl-lipoteichoic acid acyltransferase DltB (MBOAT superfamily)